MSLELSIGYTEVLLSTTSLSALCVFLPFLYLGAQAHSVEALVCLSVIAYLVEYAIQKLVNRVPKPCTVDLPVWVSRVLLTPTFFQRVFRIAIPTK